MAKVPSKSSRSRYVPQFLGILLGIFAGLFGAVALGVSLAAALGLLALGALAALAAFHGLSRPTLGGTDTIHGQREAVIEQLASKLCSVETEEQVARALEAGVQGALECDYVEVQLNESGSREDAAGLCTDSGLRPRPTGRAGSERGPEDFVAVPVAIASARFATLRVCSSRADRALSSADRALLATTSHLGALAFGRIRATRELEQRRRQQMAAWRGEREALLETVAAEIAHEVRYPINYFRSLFERTEPGTPLDREDVEIGREEVERLERLVTGLRRMATHHLERRAVSVRELCARAEALLSDSFGAPHIDTNVPAEAWLNCDAQQTSQVLVNLLTNALEAAGPKGRVGVEFRTTKSGAELVVWDTGSGFNGDPARLFTPWYTTKLRGTGLGLSITHRLVRAHGWSIQATRERERTCFTIGLRTEDLVNGSTLHRKFLSEAEVA
ncbi:MAG TPA: HAMP domain-containing sensor histidine kinase [Polyangiaceae bacterium]